MATSLLTNARAVCADQTTGRPGGQLDEMIQVGGDVLSGGAPQAHDQVHRDRGQSRQPQDDDALGGAVGLVEGGEPHHVRARPQAHQLGLGQERGDDLALGGAASLLGAVILGDLQAEVVTKGGWATSSICMRRAKRPWRSMACSSLSRDSSSERHCGPVTPRWALRCLASSRAHPGGGKGGMITHRWGSGVTAICTVCSFRDLSDCEAVGRAPTMSVL